MGRGWGASALGAGCEGQAAELGARRGGRAAALGAGYRGGWWENGSEGEPPGPHGGSGGRPPAGHAGHAADPSRIYSPLYSVVPAVPGDEVRGPCKVLGEWRRGRSLSLRGRAPPSCAAHHSTTGRAWGRSLNESFPLPPDPPLCPAPCFEATLGTALHDPPPATPTPLPPSASCHPILPPLQLSHLWPWPPHTPPSHPPVGPPHLFCPSAARITIPMDARRAMTAAAVLPLFDRLGTQERGVLSSTGSKRRPPLKTPARVHDLEGRGLSLKDLVVGELGDGGC